MRKMFIYFMILGLMVSGSKVQAQRQVFPHLQIFLLSSEPGGGLPFISFWQDGDQLAAGPFPVRLLELAGLDVLLDLSYAGGEKRVPSKARLGVNSREGRRVLDKAADWIADRGVSKMFPNAPFIVIGLKAPSEGVRWVGRIMKEIQNKILACDQNYRKELETTLDSMKGTASYDHVLRVIESTFPRCPRKGP
ncbi:MAG: hypothetical protein ACE5JU_20760 [Candidatus Binatia bacterium]